MIGSGMLRGGWGLVDFYYLPWKFCLNFTPPGLPATTDRSSNFSPAIPGERGYPVYTPTHLECRVHATSRTGTATKQVRVWGDIQLHSVVLCRIGLWSLQPPDWKLTLQGKEDLPCSAIRHHSYFLSGSYRKFTHRLTDSRPITATRLVTGRFARRTQSHLLQTSTACLRRLQSYSLLSPCWGVPRL